MVTMIIIGLSSLIFITALWYFLNKLRYSRKIKKSLNYRLFLVKVPRDFISEQQRQQQKNFSYFANTFEQLLEALSNYKKEFVFELAVPLNTQEICFYFACPLEDSPLFQKTIASLYPFAQIELVPEDYVIFHPQGVHQGAVAKLTKPFVLPLKTYKNFEEDPLVSIIKAFDKVSPNSEGAALQIILRKGEKSYYKTISSVKESLTQNKSLSEAYSSTSTLVKQAFTNIITPSDKNKEIQSPKKKIDETSLKLVEEKSQYPLFSINVRLLTSAPSLTRAKELLSHLESAFSPFTLPQGNGLKFVSLKGNPLKKLIYNFSLRLFDNKQSIILNSVEIASLFHFPHPFIENSKIKWLKARTAPPPLNIPQQGAILGINNYGGEERKIRILDEDRRRHIYIIGQTGTGKSTLLKNIFIDDVNNGKGICFIDPHGDTAEQLLGYIPENRIDDVIYFNPGDPRYSFGLNMLDWNRKYPFQKSFVTNEMLEIFDKLYDLKTVGGPVFEQYFRNAMLLLLDDPDTTHTLVDLPRILINPDFRKALLDKTPNPLVREFWQKEAEKAGGELALANVAPYINSKLNPFLANDLVRPIIGQTKTSINFRQIMDEGKILIVNLSKGLLGDTNSYLLGMILVGKLTMAAFSRVDLPEEQRKDFYLFIDEFQNITTNTIATIFSEARKYRLDLIVANQYLAQLKEPILKAVFGNVGTIISFRVGREDAELLAKYYAPVFSMYDLMNLDNFNAYVKLLIHNQTTRAFNIQTIKSPEPNKEKIAYLKNYAVKKYARPREEVELEIKQRYK